MSNGPELPWPSDLAELHQHLCKLWSVQGRIRLIRELRNGKSGAAVFVCDLVMPDFSGEAILKLDDEHPADWLEDTENERHQQAWISSPSYASEHLPRLIGEARANGRMVIATALAGGGLALTEPWLHAPYATQYPSAQKVSSEILSVWNKDYTMSEELLHPTDLLKGWLGYRLNAVEGNIENFIAECGNGSPDVPAFYVEGECLPNPYAFATTSGAALPAFCPALGRIHGDLHGENILVSQASPLISKYYLIDLALFKENQFLFYDHAYFELSYLLHTRGHSTVERWNAILDVLPNLNDPADVANNAADADDVGIMRLFMAIRKEISDWISAQEPHRRGSLQSQAILARVAAGLNFVNKGAVQPARRFLALIYSARSLKHYLSHNNIPWKTDGRILASPTPMTSSHGNTWRTIWDKSDQFDRHANVYVLVLGSGMTPSDPRIAMPLARLPWAIIADFDTTNRSEGILGAVESEILKSRGFHLAVVDDEVDLNFDQATLWLKCCGFDSRPETIRTDPVGWRRAAAPRVLKILSKLRTSTAPKPLKVLMLPGKTRPEILTRFWDQIDQAFQDDASTIVVSEPGSESFNLETGVQVSTLQCSFDELAAGLLYMLGSKTVSDEMILPGRDPCDTGHSDDINRIQVILHRAGELQNIEEDLEVVHARVAFTDDEADVTDSFLRGAEITWRELDIGMDVRRDITEELKLNIAEGLKSYRNLRFNLEHRPGAGGTTVARRIAWDLRALFPTVVVRNVSDSTAGRIDQIFKKTRLPVLVIIDDPGVSTGARDILFRNVRARSARCVMLEVTRRMDPDASRGLTDPLDAHEAARFLQRYLPVARPGRTEQLKALASSDGDMNRFRSPFFFGLFAFEEQFTHIPQYVTGHLFDASHETRHLLIFLSLITRYSQFALTLHEARLLMGAADTSRSEMAELLGPSAVRLIITGKNAIKVAHPALAEEMLRQLLPGGRQNWKSQLSQSSIELIDRCGQVFGENSDRGRELLTQMFIVREPWSASTERRRNFSELILSMPSKEGQQRVLKRLTDVFPLEAHFWNHLGRHASFVVRAPYEVAESYLKKAVAMDSNSDAHHHALGMIYRFEVSVILKGLRKINLQKPSEALAAIRLLFAAAEDCFAKARALDAESEYSYVTNAQMIIDTLEHVYRISGASSYDIFLLSTGETGQWARESVAFGMNLIEQVKRLRAEENLSSLAQECDSRLIGFFGKFEAMISGLEMLLVRKDANLPNVRRLIAMAHFARTGHKAERLTVPELRRIASLMEENLDEDPTRVQDLQVWFRTNRRLPEFDMLEAMDRLNAWALREESAEAHYLLYILHFIRWYEGLSTEVKSVRHHIARCRAIAGMTDKGKRSFEWLAKEPRWCSLVHQSALGEWKRDDVYNFYSDTSQLDRVSGIIAQIRDPQAGELYVYPKERRLLLHPEPLPVFFAPRGDFRKGLDENREVRFFLGFSYEGLRGWQVQRDTVSSESVGDDAAPEEYGKH